MIKGKPNWSTYMDVYDLYRNGTKIKRIWGRKAAIEIAEKTSGGLWGQNRIELINIKTGEVIYDIE